MSQRNSDEVREALQRAKGSVKLAVLLLQGCDLAEATAIFDQAGGKLREAMTLVDKRNT